MGLKAQHTDIVSEVGLKKVLSWRFKKKPLWLIIEKQYPTIPYCSRPESSDAGEPLLRYYGQKGR